MIRSDHLMGYIVLESSCSVEPQDRVCAQNMTVLEQKSV